MNNPAVIFLAMLTVLAGIKAAQPQPQPLIPTPTPVYETKGEQLKRFLILPPVEYDHEYGDLTIQLVNTLEELYAICGTKTPFMLACSYINQKSCLVIMVNDSIMRRNGWTTGLLLRHEQGHCNGWPGDHTGQRPLTKDTHWVPAAERAKVPRDRLERADQVRAGAPR